MRLHECEALEKQSDTQEDMKRMQEWQRDAERVGGKRFHPCVPAFLGERDDRRTGAWLQGTTLTAVLEMPHNVKLKCSIPI